MSHHHHGRHSHGPTRPKLKPCRDERFYNFLRQAVAFLDGTHLHYAAFGSVALCTWLPFAPFLPKDLDIIVDDAAWQQLPAACWAWDVPLQQEKHFARISFGHYELNVVPEHCRIFPWRSDEVVASYDLSLNRLDVTLRRLHLLPIQASIELPVPHPEALLVTGMRVIGFNTDSLQRALLLLANLPLDLARLTDFLSRTTDITPRFAEKMREIETMLTPHGHPALAQIVRINQALQQQGLA